jgi:hypothetical protein
LELLAEATPAVLARKIVPGWQMRKVAEIVIGLFLSSGCEVSVPFRIAFPGAS